MLHSATVLATCLAILLRLGTILNKTPAKAFTPLAGMKMGARLSLNEFADLLQLVETTCG